MSKWRTVANFLNVLLQFVAVAAAAVAAAVVAVAAAAVAAADVAVGCSILGKQPQFWIKSGFWEEKLH